MLDMEMKKNTKKQLIWISLTANRTAEINATASPIAVFAIHV